MTDRPDCKNVNNWHWVEKNAEPWSKEALTELLIGQEIKEGLVKILFKDFRKLEGDATANNRKAKLIFLYDWVIQINFIANVQGSDLEYKGYVDIPNLSDEFEAHEINMDISVDTVGPREGEIRHILNTTGLELVRRQLGIYIQRLKEEFSKGLILQTSKPQVVVKGGKANVFDKRSFQNEVVVAPTKETKSSKNYEYTAFEITDSFKAPPLQLYNIYTSAELIKIWAGNAQIDLREGGKFTLFGGQILGFFTKLVEGQQIEAQWRLKDYPDDHHASICFLFNDQGDSTRMTLMAKEVPLSHFEKTQDGLQRHYFQNVGQTFGIATRMF